MVRSGDTDWTSVGVGEWLRVTHDRYGVEQSLLHRSGGRGACGRAGDGAARGTTGTDTATEGVVLGLVVGIGYAAAILLTTAAFEFAKPRRWTWGVIDASYHVVGLLIAGIVIALWR